MGTSGSLGQGCLTANSWEEGEGEEEENFLVQVFCFYNKREFFI